MSNLQDLVEKIRRHLDKGSYPNEAAVSFSIVVPLLRALGWDDTDPDQVMPEYSSGGRRVDFALCSAPSRPAIFIEVKGVGKSLEGDRQLFEYAFHAGIPFCILTDGRDWHFYLPSGQGNYSERRVYRLNMLERTVDEIMEAFENFLGRSRVVSGDALDYTTKLYRQLATSREATRHIPAAWRQLIEQEEELLIDLVLDQTETMSGFRPSREAVFTFLKRLISGGEHGAVSSALPVRAAEKHLPNKSLNYGVVDHTVSGLVDHAVSPEISLGRADALSFRSDSVDTGVSFSVFGMEKTARTGKDAFLEVLSILAQRYPDKLESVAHAARGRSRNHIARTVQEIYPNRPDLANAAEFAPGWLVGLNIANREKKRILVAACDALGVSYGTDVFINLPNT